MAGRVETIARVLNGVGSRVTPRPVLRWGRALLLHRPLVWRTSLHTVLWFSCVVSVAAFGTALWLFQLPSDVWTLAELWGARATLGYLSAAVCITWGALQLRTPVGELSRSGQVRLWLLNWLGILLLFLPGFVFTLTATHRIAHSMDDAEFQEETALHQEFGFWHCSKQLTEQGLNATDRKRLAASLRKLDLTTDWVIATQSFGDCPGLSSLTIWDPDEPKQETTLLEERIASISRSKALWQHGTDECYLEHQSSLATGLALGLVGALILGALSIPRYVWQRTLLRHIQPRAEREAVSDRTGWLARLNHGLLVTHPTLWIARVDLTLVAFLAMVASTLVAWLVCAGLQVDVEEEMPVGVMLQLAAALWQYLWLVLRRSNIPVPSTARWSSVCASYFACAVAMPLLLTALGAALAGSPAAFVLGVGLTVLNGLFVISIATVRLLYGPLATLWWVLAIVVGKSITGLLIFLNGLLSAVDLTLFVAAVATALIARGQTIARVRRFAATFVILSAPVMFLNVVVLAALASTSLEDSGELVWAVFAAAIASAYPAYRYGLLPFHRVLARAGYEPRTE